MERIGHVFKLETEDENRELVGGGPRGEIKGFSRASRRRMLYAVASTGKARPIFLTLTYGKEWPSCPDVFWRHVKSWWKRVDREFRDERFAMIWKKEYQDRGAPHLHGLIYRSDSQSPFIPKEWVARSWAEVTGDTSEEHIKAGTRIESLRSYKGAMWYAAKYLGKRESTSDGQGDAQRRTGRLWGILGRKNIPHHKEEIWLTEMEMAAFRHHVAETMAESRARKDCPYRDYEVVSRHPGDDSKAVQHFLWRDAVDKRKAEILVELEQDQSRIPGTIMADDSFMNQLQTMSRIAEHLPWSEIAKKLDRFAPVS